MAETVECEMCDTTYDVEANAGSCPDCGTPDPEYTTEGPNVSEVECSNCGATVNADATYCTTCSEPLESDEGPEKPAVACPDCDETIPEGGDFCTNCGTKRTDIEDSDEEDSPTTPPSMSLVIGSNSHSIVEDGNVVVEDDSFGLDARYDAVDQGKDDSEAVTISREHLLFDVRDSEVVMIENGQNDTTFNGDILNDGEERVLSHGDEIGLNDVVTAKVELS
jgi:hypothetical protein